MNRTTVGMVVALAAGMASAEVPMPEGYAPVGYIESNGDAWLDTGYVVRPDTRIECEIRAFAGQRSPYVAVFGACDGGMHRSALQFWTRFKGEDRPTLDACGRTAGDDRRVVFPYGARTKVRYAGGQVEWDDGDERGVLSCAGAQEAGKNRLFVFDTNSGADGAERAEGNRARMRLYSLRISDGEGLRRDYRPCRDPKGVAGLWDAVGGRFAASAGKANFNGREEFAGFPAPGARTVSVGRDFYGFELPDGVALSASGDPFGVLFEEGGVRVLDARWYNNWRIVGTMKELRWEESLARRRRAEFDAFLAKLPPAPEEFAYSRKLAGYILWSTDSRPDGYLRREAMLMSKRFMTATWSWDHMFNALALCEAEPEIAWNQFAIMFDQQDEKGYIPDAVAANVTMTWACKPPIHGWAFRKMMGRIAFGRERLEQAYDWLSKWTGWWRTERLDAASGLSFYRCGCDSGWDNSTAFTSDRVILPDLQAFLVIQMETLAELAGKLGRADEAKAWQERSDDLLKRMFAHDYGKWSDSLIYHEAVVLGHRMPKEQRARYVEPLKTGRFLTEWGLATEALDSPHYERDGYWRGPIWAPDTMLIVDGLRDMGETAFADDLSRRFLRLFRKGGAAENFDAKTGEGLRDRGYTWTAAVFLEFLREAKGGLPGRATPQFSNPVGSDESPDPFVCWDAETQYYYLLFTRWNDVCVYRSKSLATLRDGESKVIYEPRGEDGVHGAIWAPEMHKAPNGKWYVYTSGLLKPGNPWGQKRLFVLESKTSDPFDGFVFKGRPAPDLFAIDPTVMTWTDGRQYICYSHATPGRGQTLVIREMENPWTFGRRQAVIARAELPWELKDQRINEGAYFVRSPDGKRLFIVYSANGCWCDDYALGVLEFTGGDLCEAKNWKKHPKQLLVKGNGAFGPGHASFFRSPDGGELWCAYHAMRESNPKRVSTKRWLNFQKVGFDETGYPVMGVCNGAGPHAVPAGE